MTDEEPVGFLARYVKLVHDEHKNEVRFWFAIDVSKFDEASKILGGIPRPPNEWFVIARLPQQRKASDTQVIPGEVDISTGESSSQPRPRRSWDELTPTQQAGIRCGEPRFRKFLLETFVNCNSDDDTAHMVRVRCGVPSRKNLIANPGRARWLALENQYQEWLAKS